MPELASSFADAWAQFQRRDALRLAGDALEWEWSRGRAQYLAFLVRIDEPAVRAHLATVIERIKNIPGIEAYPDDYWHATVKGVGFQVVQRTRDDEILRGEVSRMAGKARALLTKQSPFRASLGQVNAFADVVFVEVIDDGETSALNRLLLNGLDEVSGAKIDAAGFLPHISIARFTSNDGLAELKSALTSLREEPPGPEMTVQRVELVRAWLSEDTPDFETVASFTLSGAIGDGTAGPDSP